MSIFTSRRRDIAAISIAAAGISLLGVAAAATPALAELNVAPATQTDTTAQAAPAAPTENAVISGITTAGQAHDGGFQIKSGTQAELDAFATGPTDPSGTVADSGAQVTVTVGQGNKIETYHTTVDVLGDITIPSVNYSPTKIAKTGEITIAVAQNGNFSAATATAPYWLV